MKPYTTTLKELRKAGACYEGYNRVVRALQGRDPTGEDLNRTSYLRTRLDPVIPLSSILDSNFVEDTAWTLQNTLDPDTFAAEYRGFVGWCVEQLTHIPDPHPDPFSFAGGMAAALRNRLHSAPTWDRLDCSAYALPEILSWYAGGGSRCNYTYDRAVVTTLDMFRRMCDGTAPWQTEAQPEEKAA